MSGTRGGFGRIVALGVGLALALLLLAASEATAGKYAVAQCGWYVGADADWADSTGGAKFRPDAYCVPPAGADPFDGAHMKSLTRDGQSTVTGTRFARWRWTAPAGTGITQVRGTWWHTLHDGIEQRIGVGNWGGGFDVFAAAGGTDVTPREFVAGFPTPMPAIEDRLLCARAESKWCSLDPGSWSAVRALTITIQDNSAPAASIGGELTWGAWRRGAQALQFWGSDLGSGIRFGETTLDGARVALTEHACAMASIGGEWRATRMQPCLTGVSGTQSIATTSFSDGPHTLGHCAVDFAGNVGCAAARTVSIDNNAPAHPRNLALAGGEGWRRANDFDLSWADPDQGAASPIGGASWRIVGPAGFDTGVRFSPGRDLAALSDLSVPAPGAYTLQIWLRDEAGNEAPPSAISVPLRLDNVAPGVAFDVDAGSTGLPERIQATISDAHSGPASGAIYLRRLGTEQWTDLSAKFQPGNAPDVAHLTAPLPGDLGPGTYLFRADAADGAGNVASTTRRADGTEMALRKVPPAPAVKPGAPVTPPKAKTRIFARLRWGHGFGSDLTVPFGVDAAVNGRLVRADGAGLPGRELRIVARPSHGALVPTGVDAVTTGPRGGFRLDLGTGPSRRITVSYPGDAALEESRRPSLALRVRGGIGFHAAPTELRTGQVVRLTGRVRTLGAPVPRRGKLVAIQYFEAATRRWRPVLVTRSDHDGRFRARYRFHYVTGVASIRLRATALSEDGWPYATGASRPVTVRVTG
jgi:hypothetical protein